MSGHVRRGFCLAATLVLLLSACGGDGTVEESTTSPQSTTTTTEPTTTTSPSGLVTSLEDVRRAVVRIVANGSFVDPEVGLQQNVAGSGSGFIISEDGTAVTNNHVVTGAAFLEVYVAGEDRPRNAKILGVSECSDLALIDIDGEGLPYLEFAEGEPAVALKVYTAGYPLGDPEYTVTAGIVSKARAGGESQWASVDYVIEHDARINPGNSGGPLVDEQGKVVGINYAAIASIDQYFAIAADGAKPIIEQLASGGDVTSLGINGVAVQGEGVTGIWVSSVESGSPADRVGIRGGDIVTDLEGFTLATDGTMADYCDILRSHNAGDELSVQVLRYATSEILTGKLNSGAPMEVSLSFLNEVQDEASLVDAASYDEYVTITDDSGTLIVDVPSAWSDVDTTPSDFGAGELWPSILAAPDLTSFLQTYETPGLIFGAVPNEADDLSLEGVFETISAVPAECSSAGVETYEDPLFTGLFNVWNDCGEAGASVVWIAAQRPEESRFVIIAVQALTDADLEALDQILLSFNFTD